MINLRCKTFKMDIVYESHPFFFIRITYDDKIKSIL